MRVILGRLIKAELKLKPRRRELCMQSATYLGFTVDAGV